MAMCIRAILSYDRRVENEYKYRLSRIGQFVNSNYDDEMMIVLRFTTHYVTEQIELQYASALEKYENYIFTRTPDDSDIVLVRGNSSVYTPRADNWKCDCEFSLTMSLPCRHAIAFRKREKYVGPLIPWSCIDERWTSSAQPLKKVKQFDYEKFRDKGPGSNPLRVRTSANRYREAVRATHLMSSELADTEDDAEFEEMRHFVLNQWRSVRQRKVGATKHPRSLLEKDPEDEATKRDFDISSNEEDDDGDTRGAEDDGDNEPSTKVAIRLNPKAKKVEAPKKPKKRTVAGEKEGKKWYEAVELGWKKAGEVTLDGLLATLNLEMPGLIETERRLSGIIVKFKDAEAKRPKFKRVKNPVLIMDTFFALPSKLLDAYLKVLLVSNSEPSAIVVDRLVSSRNSTNNHPLDIVQIKDKDRFPVARSKCSRRSKT